MAKVISTVLSLRDNMSGGLLKIARNIDGITPKMQAATRNVLRFKDKISKAVSNTVKTTAKVGLAAGAGFAAFAVKSGASFEAQMSKVKAISGASNADMVRLTQVAKKMGETTKFTATESGQALEYMAMAGWKTDQMISGLPGIMNLAAASGEDLGLVSDIVTDALTAFGMKAEDAGRFADVLAAASSNSNTNVAMMGETFKYAAPVAGALGYSIEDTAVAIGLMANAGVKADQAGTSLRGVLTNLAKPSEQNLKYIKKLGVSLTDSAGKTKPLAKLLGEFRAKFAKLTEAQKAEYAAGIAGKNAMAGFLAMMNGSDADFNKITKSIENSSGAAKNMADTMNNNLLGQLTLLKSSAEGIGIRFYEAFGEKAKNSIVILSGWLQRLKDEGTIDKWAEQAGEAFAFAVDKLREGFAWIQKHSEQIKDVISKIAIGFAVFKGVQILGNIAKSINDLILFGRTIGQIAKVGIPTLIAGFKKIGGGIFGVGKSLLGLAAAHPFIALLVVGALLIIKYWDKLKPLFQSIGEKLRAMWDSLKEFGRVIATVFGGLWDSLLLSGQHLTDWISARLNDIGTWWTNVTTWCSNAKDSFVNAFGRIKDAIVGAFDAAKSNVVGFFSLIDEKISNIPIIGNLYGGVKSAVGWVGDKIGGFYAKQKELVNQIDKNRKIGANAMGTHYWGGGLTRVHERGGEIINLPSGTQIIPHDISKKTAGGGQSINVHINVQGNMIGNEQAANMFGEIIVGKIKMALANM
jgi:TP901 family phage tail tape measure protein|nr:MAG TPA: minor tail protein [Caudoviricetes sp.]